MYIKINRFSLAAAEYYFFIAAKDEAMLNGIKQFSVAFTNLCSQWQVWGGLSDHLQPEIAPEMTQMDGIN